MERDFQIRKIENGKEIKMYPYSKSTNITFNDGKTLQEKLDNGELGGEAAGDISSHANNTTIHITSSERTKWNAAEQNAKTYAEQLVDGLVDGAPEALDTLKELSDALTTHEGAYEALLTEVGKKSPVGHKHVKSEITDFPTSLPANGGTASFLGNAVEVTNYDTLVPTKIAQGNITPIKAASGAKSPWSNTTSGFLIQSNAVDSFHILIFRSGSDGWAYRSYYQGVWNNWVQWSKTEPVQPDWNATTGLASIKNKPTSLPASGGNADTLDGYHATDFLNTAGGTVRGTLSVSGANINATNGNFYTNQYVQMEARSGYGAGVASLWYDSTNNIKTLNVNNVSDIILDSNKVYHEGRKPSPADIGAAAASHGTHVSYGTTTAGLTAGASGTTGSSASVSRADHTHALPVYPTLASLGALSTSGGIIGGDLGINGTHTITKSGDGAQLLKLNSERSWIFEQMSTAGTSKLALRSSTSDKNFYICNPTKTKGMEVFVSDSQPTTVHIDGGKVYHANNKPTASDVGALSTSGGTVSGKTTFSDYISLGGSEQNSFTKNSLMLYDGSGGIKYGVGLWNTNGTTGDWSTMIFGPSQPNRRISFGKVNSETPTTHSHITEGAYFDLNDWSLNLKNSPVVRNSHGPGLVIQNGVGRTMMSSSSAVGEHLFGGNNDGSATMVDYIRVGTNKLQYYTGGSTKNIYHTGNKPTAADVGAIPTSASCNKNWNWSGQGGQPPWLWGGSDGTNMYVYDPKNFSVSWANGAGHVNVGMNNSGVFAGNGDSASSSVANIQMKSWYGIGFSPSISGQGVPEGENSHWFNVRNGDMGMRGSLSASGSLRTSGSALSGETLSFSDNQVWKSIDLTRTSGGATGTVRFGIGANADGPSPSIEYKMGSSVSNSNEYRVDLCKTSTRLQSTGTDISSWLGFYSNSTRIGYLGRGTQSNEYLYMYAERGAAIIRGAYSSNLGVCLDSGNFFRPESNNNVASGHSSYRWSTVYYTNLNAASDERLKENIKYVAENEIVQYSDSSATITTKDCYNFVKDDLRLATYDYKANALLNEQEQGRVKDKLGFIAQDLINTKVGSFIVQEDEVKFNDTFSEYDVPGERAGEYIQNPSVHIPSVLSEGETTLSYDLTDYVNVLAGALKTAIGEIEDLKNRIYELENK